MNNKKNYGSMTFCTQFFYGQLQKIFHLNNVVIHKRGLSAIIGTVLIILITVSAASLIALFLVPFIKENLAATECFNYRDYFAFENEFGYNCYELSDNVNAYKMSISAKTESNQTQQNVKGFGLAFIEKVDSKVLIVEDGADPFEIRMLSDPAAILKIPKSGEVRSYNYTTNANSPLYEQARIYAVLQSGRKCEISDDIHLEVCDG